MNKKSIEEMAQNVANNYVSFIREPVSRSVSKEKIINFIEGLIKRGITVVLAMTPNVVVNDVMYSIKTYKIDDDHPLEIEDNVDTLYLYQWYAHEGWESEVIRFATKLKSEKEN